jgi:branched-chain amino acid transport system permease protein
MLMRAPRVNVVANAVRRRHSLGFGVVVAVCALIPSMMADYNVALVNTAAIAAIAAMALNLVMGFAGQVTAGSSALLAVGAYTAATFTTYQHWPFLLVLLVATTVGAVVGLLVGLPSLRVRGMYLAVSTLALHFIVIFFFTKYQARAAGSTFVVPIADVFGLSIETSQAWFYLLLVVVALTYLICRNLQLSKFGRAWMLIRDAPLVCASQGISLARYKLLAFVISSALTALAGALLAYYQTAVYIDTFTLDLAIQFIAMIIIGGLGSSVGAIVGAIFVTLLPTVLQRLVDAIPVSGTTAATLQSNIGDLQLIAYGVLVVAFLIFQPGGFAALGRSLVGFGRDRLAPRRKSDSRA